MALRESSILWAILYGFHAASVKHFGSLTCLRSCVQRCQKLLHVLESVAFLQAVKHSVDLIGVVQCSGAHGQFSYLARVQQRQRFKLKHNMDSRRYIIDEADYLNKQTNKTNNHTQRKDTHAGEIFIQCLQMLQGSVGGEVAKVLRQPVGAVCSFGKAGRIWIEHLGNKKNRTPLSRRNARDELRCGKMPRELQHDGWQGKTVMGLKVPVRSSLERKR